MILSLLFAAIFVSSSYADTRTCPNPGGAYALCQLKVVYIIDTTPYMNADNITVEFDWLRFNILPGTAWDTEEQIAFMSYGTGSTSTNPLSNRQSFACISLDTLQDSYLQQGSSPASLKTALQIYGITYPDATSVVLFSASQDQNDIDLASSYARSSLQWSHFTVVAMNGANFSNFPAEYIYNVGSLTNAPHNLAPCIVQRACNVTSACDVNNGTVATVLTAPPTTPSTPKPPSTTTTVAPPPTTPSSGGGNSSYGCACNYQTVWNDVIFLFDSSQATTNEGLQEMWDSILSMLYFFNVQNLSYSASDYFMRVGVISYASQVQTIASLGQYNYDQLINIENIPYYPNDAQTNLEAAIQLAVTQFDSAAHRPSSTKVIVVMSSVYNDAGVNAPQEAAESFQESGGILMVYDYIQVHGIEDEVMKQIASRGYFFTNLNNTLEDLERAQCDANCFCQKNRAVFSSDPIRNYPTEGCYTTSTTQANNMLAKSRCALQGGNLTTDKTSEKNTFLASLFGSSPANFYIALSFDSAKMQWVWIDGTPLGSYHAWYNGVTPPGTDGKQCVYVTGTNSLWVPTDCRNPYDYNCQLSPCDSMHYCSER